MKKIIFLLLCFAPTSRAAVPTFVRNNSATNNTSATTISITSQTTTAGDGAVVTCFGDATSGVTVSVADGGTDTFTAISTIKFSTTEGANGQQFYIASLAGGSKTITCTWTLAQGFKTIFYQEYSGMSGSPLDVSGNSSSDSGGASATPNVTLTTAANTVTVAASVCANTCSVGSCTPNSCTNGVSDGAGDEAMDQANSAGGSTKMQLSQTSGNYLLLAASFKGTSGAATPTLTLGGKVTVGGKTVIN